MRNLEKRYKSVISHDPKLAAILSDIKEYLQKPLAEVSGIKGKRAKPQEKKSEMKELSTYIEGLLNKRLICF